MSRDYNSLYTDKNKLNLSSNTRYNNRNLLDIELKKGNNSSNLERINIERDEFMKNSYLEETENNNFNDNNGGEHMERGMPSRPMVSIRKNMHEQNIHPEYILRKTDSNKNTNAFDPYAEKGSFADINSDTKISSSVKVESMCSENINSLSIFFVKNLLKILVTPFAISSIDIYSAFSSIYLGSKGNTEIELKNYFEFPRRDLLLENYSIILNDMQKNSSHVKSGSCILFDENLPVNQSFCKYINKLSNLRKINLGNVSSEVNTINNIVSQLTQNDMKKSVSSQNLERLNVLLLTYSYANPTLLLNNIQMKMGDFHSIFTGSSQVKYVYASEQVFGFIETDSMKILEICCESSEVMFGLITLDGGEINFNKKDLMNSTKNLKPVLFNYIQFPMFTIKTKLKLKNVFKKTDLQTIFVDLNCPELFSEKTRIDEVLQNTEIKIDNKFKKVKSTSEFKSAKTFILDKSFVYYLRLRKTNTIFMIGVF